MEQKASMETPLFLRMKDRKKNNHEKVIRYKTTEHVQNRKHKRDEDGFFVPVAMFRPYTGDGLLCEVLGKTRARQLADLKAQREYLMKEAYEHAIERMMCLVRLRELDSHKRIVQGKREEDVLHYYSEVNEQGSTTGVEKTVSEMSEPEKRRAIFNTITWQYDWIQQNKKRCFQFAEAVIDCKIVANQIEYWYDEVGCADKTERMKPTEHADTTEHAEHAEHSEHMKPAETHEEDRDGESS